VMWTWISGYLLFCFSGWFAFIEMERMPLYGHLCDGTAYKYDGSDVSLCTALMAAGLVLFPPFTVVANVLWVPVLWRSWRKGRPLPKCPVLFKGRSAR
jgi:hypothetical protein